MFLGCANTGSRCVEPAAREPLEAPMAMSTYRPLSLVTTAAVVVLLASPGRASDTPDPGTVTVTGSLQSELGCAGDWDPACAATHLAYDTEDRVWQATFVVPAGSWEYKAALDDAWTENYGINASPNGANIPLNLGAAQAVKLYYDHETHWITDNVNTVIATAVGSFQSELGCPGDWDPSCLRSWLQNPDGDGVFTFVAPLPAGSYEVKVAHAESFAENYGAGGVQNGPNIPFVVSSDCAYTLFSYDLATHVLTVSPTSAIVPQPGSVTVAGSFQSELGCAGDWDPACAATHLAYDSDDTVWQATFAVPAGSWEYKAAIDDAWTENYGINATPNGPNIPLNLGAAQGVKLYYDHETHWITDSVNSVIATAAGSFQSELGCPGDWDPGCLRSWLQDPDGDGVYTMTAVLPPGDYEVKVAIDESWAESYGAAGVPNGPSLFFTAAGACGLTTFRYDAVSHLLLVAQATATEATVTALASSANPSAIGLPVTFTAGVSPAAATGSVTFYDGPTPLGTALLVAGSAALVTAGLSLGTHSIVAAYGGDALYLPSVSPALEQQVVAPIPALGLPGLALLASLLAAAGWLCCRRSS